VIFAPGAGTHLAHRGCRVPVAGVDRVAVGVAGKGASSGVGFAIPIDQVKGLVDQILAYGRIVRPVLGISIAPPQVHV